MSTVFKHCRTAWPFTYRVTVAKFKRRRKIEIELDMGIVELDEFEVIQ